MIKPNPTQKTIGEILELRKNNMLQVNPEYQRGAVWTRMQQQKLIDSVLRGYPLPLIYLHHIKREVAGFLRDDLQIIDGQQRINAFDDFSRDGWPLLNPQEESAKFPFFLKEEPCPWAGQKFNALSEAIQKQFRDTRLSVVEMECSKNEVRDLFTRLQAGTPLTAQEKRDAMVGDFAELVLKIGGKPELGRIEYGGHDFFKKIVRPGNRGKVRQLVGQILMLYLHRKQQGGEFLSVKADGLDNFYYRHVGLDLESETINRFRSILDCLARLLGDGRRPPLKGPDAIHIILLADSLWDNYTSQWRGKLAEAYDIFASKLTEAKRVKMLTGQEDKTIVDLWNYHKNAGSGSDGAQLIKFRHEIYLQYMRDFLGDSLVAKDPQRVFPALDREMIYYRDNKTCWHCVRNVKWDDAEIHHIVSYGDGGKTKIENGALLHQDCHRTLSTEDKKKLRENFEKYKGKMTNFSMDNSLEITL